MSSNKAEPSYKLANRSLSDKLSTVIANLDSLPSGSAVLNLGSGDGVLERHVSKNRKYTFTSIDLEPAAIHTIKTIFNDASKDLDDQAVVGDITDIESIPIISNQHYDAAISWRVLHGIDPIHYLNIFKSVHSKISKGSPFFAAVACDRDWKAEALGESLNLSGVNNCTPIMFRPYGIGRETAFPVHFFTPKEIISLGDATGFNAVTVDYFEEPSGYSHLKDKKNTYLFVKFIAR